ncbi:MAG: hypothetical protein JHC40_04275 [Burkholderiales bacterium]|jgi:hypothetical protein|nr:hypothetical protein [Burkholderiales bacterium]
MRTLLPRLPHLPRLLRLPGLPLQRSWCSACADAAALLAPASRRSLSTL